MANRICLACGKEYDYCSSCPTSTNLPVWKNIFDTENCKTIFETVSDYAQKVITKNVAKNKLSALNLSINYKKNIQKYIDEITAEEFKVLDETISDTKTNDIKYKKKNKAYT